MSMQERIEKKIREALNPDHVEVINESHRHKGHAGDNGTGESHFKLMVVSSGFSNLKRIERQRLIFNILKEEMPLIHALSLDLKGQ